MTTFLAIYKTDIETLIIEYRPLENGAVEIVSFAIQPRRVAPFQQTNHKRRRGLVLSEEDIQAETMQPYTKRETR